MSCSARLPVYILMIAAFFPVRDEEHPAGFGWYVPGLVMFGMYMVGLIVAPLVALLLKRTLLRGETPAFVMEMPLYKLPLDQDRCCGACWRARGHSSIAPAR